MSEGTVGVTARRLWLWLALLLCAAAVAVLIALHPGPLNAFAPWVAGKTNVVGTQTFIAGRGFASPRALQEHFANDGAAFGADSPADYDALARQFFQNRALWERAVVGSTIRLYDPKTNTFGSYTDNGETLSFFKPATGAKYWAKILQQHQ